MQARSQEPLRAISTLAHLDLVTTPAVSASQGLTDRELHVLRLLVHFRTDTEIALARGVGGRPVWQRAGCVGHVWL